MSVPNKFFKDKQLVDKGSFIREECPACGEKHRLDISSKWETDGKTTYHAKCTKCREMVYVIK